MRSAESIRFGTDGWRAVIAREFTVENVARLTFGLAAWIKTQPTPHRAVVGFDCRFGGELFSRTVVEVLQSEGIEVMLSDRIVSTPMVSMATRDLNCTVGVMITASHNPPEYNGYKLKSHHGGPMGGQALREIESLIPDEISTHWASSGPMSKDDRSLVDLESPYVHAIEQAFDLEAIRKTSPTLAYDAMYGSGQFVMRRLFPSMAHFRSENNPSFHGISPEPIARNLAPFASFLTADPGLELGLVTDGDADRIGLMDGQGEFIDSHHIILLLIHYLVKYKGLEGKVVTAFSTVSKVTKLCQLYGLPLEIVKIGFKYASEIMVKEPVMLAGEESGGIAVETHIPERDGIWMGLLLVEFMAETGKSIKELIQEVYDQVGAFAFVRDDLRLTDEQKYEAVQRCALSTITSIGSNKVQRVEDMDGWKFILDEDTWVMIRPSGTEPVLRLYAEAPDRERALEIIAATKSEIGVA
ncbi:MAG: phosphoglucomutase/phosphomannomutase family protein [Flavobacteriales bacterium]|nr:phosphoglucomutase/phosphomannomutase family protein [Flavobacteriales bacterium]